MLRYSFFWVILWNQFSLSDVHGLGLRPKSQAKPSQILGLEWLGLAWTYVKAQSQWPGHGFELIIFEEITAL